MLNIPTNQSTMIGSMPHKSVEEAYKLLTEYPLSIPAWPQLPKRSFKEAMIPQYSEGFPGIKVDEQDKRIWVERDEDLPNTMAGFYENVVTENLDAFGVSEDYAAGLHYFLHQVGPASEKLPLIKGQVTGPFTFGLGLNDQERKAVWFDEQYRDVVLKGLAMKAVWQVRELKKYAQNVVLFFDEPILSALGTPAYMGIQDEDVISGLNEVINAAQQAGAYVGVHCCGNMDWGLLAQTDLDIISFDAYFYGEKVALYPEDINAFLQRGGMLACGIVPTGDAKKLHQETPDSLRRKHEELIQGFVHKGLAEEQIRGHILFTPSCGMGSGSLSPEDSRLVLELLSKISHEQGPSVLNLSKGRPDGSTSSPRTEQDLLHDIIHKYL
jgi:hypothetical protein